MNNELQIEREATFNARQETHNETAKRIAVEASLNIQKSENQRLRDLLTRYQMQYGLVSDTPPASSINTSDFETFLAGIELTTPNQSIVNTASSSQPQPDVNDATGTQPDPTQETQF